MASLSWTRLVLFCSIVLSYSPSLVLATALLPRATSIPAPLAFNPDENWYVLDASFEPYAVFANGGLLGMASMACGPHSHSVLALLPR